MFRAERITEALWPEALGVGLYLGGSIIAAAIDTAQQEVGTYDFPVAQNVVTWGSLVGGAAMVGYHRGHDIGKGLMLGSGIGVLATALRAIYEGTRKVEGRARLSDCAALIPRRVGAVRRSGGGGGRLGTGGGAAMKLNAGRSLNISRAKMLTAGVPRGGSQMEFNSLPRQVLPTIESTRGM